MVRCQLPARGFIGSRWRVAVISAKAGIHSACHRKQAVYKLDSRFRGNDSDFEMDPIPNGTMAPRQTTDNGPRTTDVLLMHPIPTKIKLAAGNDTLSIHWSDGHASAYSYPYLRDRCPCASCREGGGTHRQPSNLLPMLGVKPLRPERAELVGRYALQVFWNDGHSSGIYSFDYLRSLCSCPQCEISRRATQTPG